MRSYTADIEKVVARREPWPALPNVGNSQPVTKELYRRTAEVFFQGIRDTANYWLQQPKPYPNIGLYTEAAGWFCRMYTLTGDEQHARSAVACLGHAHRLISEPQDDTTNTQPGWLNVVGDAGHSHARRPAILALADHQSVLLMSLGYMERRPEDHNLSLLADYDGFLYDNTPYHIRSDNNQVREATAVDLGAAGYGRVRIDRYLGYPAEMVREIVFVKGAGVVVKDTLTLGIDLRVRWGQVYRTRNIGPNWGATWLGTSVGPWVPLRGLGRDAPVYTRWRNDPRELLIYFLPHRQGNLEVIDERSADSTLSLPLRVQYMLRQELRRGVATSSVAILIPHEPDGAAPLADRVRVLLDEPDRTIVEFPDASGVGNLIVLNASGCPVAADTLTTDARVACVRRSATGVLAVGQYGGQYLRLEGENLTRKAPAPTAHVVPSP